MKKKLTLFLWVFTQLLRCLPSAAQCAEVEAVLKDIVTREINPKVVSQSYDTFEKITCYTLEGITVDDFVLLGRGLEYSKLIQNDPKTVDYYVLRMIDRTRDVACEHVYIRRSKNTKSPTFNHIQRQKIANLIKVKEENLALLKQQQAYLNTDILNILGDVLVGQIDAPVLFSDIVSEAAQRLKDKGIEQVSKYYELEYVPSENETADLVRKIIGPIDKALGSIPTGKYLKYWEALKLTTDGGMVIGNVAAKVRIYFMEKELQDDIDNLKRRLSEIPGDTSSNIHHSNTSEEHIYLKSNW